MIDVSHKFSTLRYARAEGILTATEKTIDLVRQGKVPKGDVLQVARAAGISDRFLSQHTPGLDRCQL